LQNIQYFKSYLIPLHQNKIAGFIANFSLWFYPRLSHKTAVVRHHAALPPRRCSLGAGGGQAPEVVVATASLPQPSHPPMQQCQVECFNLRVAEKCEPVHIHSRLRLIILRRARGPRKTQMMAAHESLRTSQLYDRTSDALGSRYAPRTTQGEHGPFHSTAYGR
jgi:hypothetical protein